MKKCLLALAVVALGLVGVASAGWPPCTINTNYNQDCLYTFNAILGPTIPNHPPTYILSVSGYIGPDVSWYFGNNQSNTLYFSLYDDDDNQNCLGTTWSDLTDQNDLGDGTADWPYCKYLFYADQAVQLNGHHVTLSVDI